MLLKYDYKEVSVKELLMYFTALVMMGLLLVSSALWLQGFTGCGCDHFFHIFMTGCNPCSHFAVDQVPVFAMWNRFQCFYTTTCTQNTAMVCKKKIRIYFELDLYYS